MNQRFAAIFALSLVALIVFSVSEFLRINPPEGELVDTNAFKCQLKIGSQKGISTDGDASIACDLAKRDALLNCNLFVCGNASSSNPNLPLPDTFDAFFCGKDRVCAATTDVQCSKDTTVILGGKHRCEATCSCKCSC